MKTTFARQFTMTSCMILLSFFMLGSAFFSLIYSYLITEKQRALRATAGALVDLATAYSLTDDLELNSYFRISLSTTSRIAAADAVYCDASGFVTMCSDQAIWCEHIGHNVDENIINYLMLNGSYEGYGNLNNLYENNRYIYVTALMTSAGEFLGYVFVSSGIEDTVVFVRQAAGIFVSTAALVLILTFLVTTFIVRNQSRPLREMAAAARRFARGDFSVRVRTSSRVEEISELSSSFNNMAQSLEKSESMRREFIANISHELRTPMTTIAGFVDGILDGTIPYERQNEYLKIVSAEVRRLSRLVRKMLELSRYQSGENPAKLESFDLNELIGRVLLSFENKITGKDLQVNLRLPELAIYVTAEYDSITQVLYNLLDNSVKFSRPSGELRVTLEKNGPKAIVTVSNYGETIPPAELAMIFNRFHKTDRSRSEDREGVGLGLYIVKTILSNHGEDITVSSQDGLTEFQFTLTQSDKKRKAGEGDRQVLDGRTAESENPADRR